MTECGFLSFDCDKDSVATKTLTKTDKRSSKLPSMHKKCHKRFTTIPLKPFSKLNEDISATTKILLLTRKVSLLNFKLY